MLCCLGHKGRIITEKEEKEPLPLTERELDHRHSFKACFFTQVGGQSAVVLDVGRHRAFGNTTETAHLTFQPSPA